MEEELPIDAEIEAVLDFTPVPRKVKRPDGWTPELQREFIHRLALCGSPKDAAVQMGKNISGVESLYKDKAGKSFRRAWDAALAAGQRRKAEQERGQAWAGRAPGVNVRPSILSGQPGSRPGGVDLADEPQMSEDEKWELVERLATKFLKKVAAEREARLGGEIVAADFYLRQITMIEVAFDLTATGFGWDPREVLRDLRRGGHGPLDVVSTPFTDWLDVARRHWWAEEGAPERPRYPDPRFLKRHGRGAEAHSTYVDQGHTGAPATPARGHSPEEWAALSSKEQKAAWEKQFEEDADEQRAYERRAIEEWRERVSTERSAPALPSSRES